MLSGWAGKEVGPRTVSFVVLTRGLDTHVCHSCLVLMARLGDAAEFGVTGSLAGPDGHSSKRPPGWEARAGRDAPLRPGGWMGGPRRQIPRRPLNVGTRPDTHMPCCFAALRAGPGERVPVS